MSIITIIVLYVLEALANAIGRENEVIDTNTKIRYIICPTVIYIETLET